MIKRGSLQSCLQIIKEMSDLSTKLIGKLQFHNHWQTLDIVLELQIDIYKIQTSKSVLSKWF